MRSISCQPWAQLQKTAMIEVFPKSLQQMYLKTWTEWLQEWIMLNMEMCWLNTSSGNACGPFARITITGIIQLPALADIALALENFITHSPMFLGVTLTPSHNDGSRPISSREQQLWWAPRLVGGLDLSLCPIQLLLPLPLPRDLISSPNKLCPRVCFPENPKGDRVLHCHSVT